MDLYYSRDGNIEIKIKKIFEHECCFQTLTLSFSRLFLDYYQWALLVYTRLSLDMVSLLDNLLGLHILLESERQKTLYVCIARRLIEQKKGPISTQFLIRAFAFTFICTKLYRSLIRAFTILDWNNIKDPICDRTLLSEATCYIPGSTESNRL